MKDCAIDEETQEPVLPPLEAFEALTHNCRNHLQRFPKHLDAWILLHCLYKQSGYVPGVEYARWKYEALLKIKVRGYQKFPISRWKMYNNLDLLAILHPGASLRLQTFCYTIETFLKFGMYEFAKVVFSSIENQFNPSHSYMMNTTFCIFVGDKNSKEIKNQKTKLFPSSKDESSLDLVSKKNRENIIYIFKQFYLNVDSERYFFRMLTVDVV